LFNVDASLMASSVEVVRVDELFSPGPTKFVIEFLSPIRFARRRTMRRRRVKYDFCPSMENIARSTINYWVSALSIGLLNLHTSLKPSPISITLTLNLSPSNTP